MPDKTDIVERLREPHRGKTGREAADEIERLRGWNYRLLQRADAAQTEVERLLAEREHDPNVAPCDDAEFGMKP